MKIFTWYCLATAVRLTFPITRQAVSLCSYLTRSNYTASGTLDWWKFTYPVVSCIFKTMTPFTLLVRTTWTTTSMVRKNTVIFPLAFTTLQQLTGAINNSNDTYKHHMLEPVKERNGYYTIRHKCDCIQPHATHCNEKIRHIFGFDDATGWKTLFMIFNKNKIPF